MTVAEVLNNVPKRMNMCNPHMRKLLPSHGASVVLGEPYFYRRLLIAVTKSVADRVRHDHFCDRTHKMIGNFIQFEGLIDIVIAGWGGSGGNDGGGGGRGCGRRS